MPNYQVSGHGLTKTIVADNMEILNQGGVAVALFSSDIASGRRAYVAVFKLTDSVYIVEESALRRT